MICEFCGRNTIEQKVYNNKWICLNCAEAIETGMQIKHQQIKESD